MEPRGYETQLKIPAGNALLDADLAIPALNGQQRLVIFAHGTGSGRKSQRNRFVAEALQRRGMSTLLFDLLTPRERMQDADGYARVDIQQLGERMVAVGRWLLDELSPRFTIGYYGSSTGAAAALLAASMEPEIVDAVVSRGGRPDLVESVLPTVLAPTLLIVGGADAAVLELNKRALVRFAAPAHLSVVPGATHLFAERGALESVADLTGDWFVHYLGGRPDKAPAIY